MADVSTLRSIADAAGRTSLNGAKNILNSANGNVNQAIKIAKANLAADLSLGQVGKAVTSSGNSAQQLIDIPISGTGIDLTNAINQIMGIGQQNSAFNAAEAEKQRQFEQQMMNQQMQFNAAEAQKNRDWQQGLADTAHQREIADLKAAGLNPVLSAMNGTGAYVGSGATANVSLPSGSSAQADTSVNGALVSLLGHFISAQTQLQAADVSAKTNLAVADKYNAMSELVANLNAGVSKYVADVGHSNAELSSAATQIAASLNASAARYGYDISNLINDKKLAQELLIKELYPDNQWRVLNDIFQHLTNDRSQSGFSSALDVVEGLLDRYIYNSKAGRDGGFGKDDAKTGTWVQRHIGQGRGF